MKEVDFIKIKNSHSVKDNIENQTSVNMRRSKFKTECHLQVTQKMKYLGINSTKQELIITNC